MTRRFVPSGSFGLVGRAAAGVVVAAAAIATCSCTHTSGRSPYAEGAQPTQRDPEKSRGLVAKAKEQWKKDPDSCEKLLHQALVADLYNGPAHNNLGVLLLQKGNLYEASAEFEWARKLMPGHPDPRVNLALTLEKAGKTNDALESYDSALAVYDNYLPAIEGKARLQIASGRAGKSTVPLLDEIALRGDEQWRSWAMVWRAKLQPAATMP